MSRAENIKKGLTWGWVNSAITLIFPFIIRTILLYTLGIEYVGMNGVFASLINVLNISELGFGASVSFLLYKPIAENDYTSVREILGFTRKCFHIIGIVILIIGMILVPFLNKLVSKDIPKDINIYILYLIYLFNTVISYMMFSYKRILFSAGQRYDIETNISSVAFIFQYILQSIVLLLFRNYYIYVLIIPLATILNNILCGWITQKKYPQYYCCGTISDDQIKIVKKKVQGAFYSKIGSTVFLSVDNIVISAIFGLKMVGQYSNYYMIISIVLGFFAIIHNTLRPIVGNYMITEDKVKTYSLFKDIYFIYLWLAAACSAAMLCLYQDFIGIWAGKEFLFSYGMVVLFVVYWYTERLTSIMGVFIEAAGLWWESRYIPIIAAGVNLLLNIILSLTIGMAGVLISTIVSVILIISVGNLMIAFKYIFPVQGKKDWFRYECDIIIRSLLAILCTVLLADHIIIHTWVGLVCKGMTMAIIFVFAFAFANVFNNYAKSPVSMIKNYLIKRKGK